MKEEPPAFRHGECQLIDLLMHEQGLERHEARFQDAARHCADMLARGHTVAQVLDALPEDTVDQRVIVEQLRAFLYTIRLRMVVVVAQGAARLSTAEADELHGYLKNL